MIFQGGDYGSSDLSPDEVEQKFKLWDKWIAELKEEDLFISGAALKSQSKQIKNEDLVMTDGPFVESNELVTGFFMVKARDLDHAKSLTSGYPDFDLGGTIQIRETLLSSDTEE